MPASSPMPVGDRPGAGGQPLEWHSREHVVRVPAMDLRAENGDRQTLIRSIPVREVTRSMVGMLCRGLRSFILVHVEKGPRVPDSQRQIVLDRERGLGHRWRSRENQRGDGSDQRRQRERTRRALARDPARPHCPAPIRSIRDFTAPQENGLASVLKAGKQMGLPVDENPDQTPFLGCRARVGLVNEACARIGGEPQVSAVGRGLTIEPGVAIVCDDACFRLIGDQVDAGRCPRSATGTARRFPGCLSGRRPPPPR